MERCVLHALDHCTWTKLLQSVSKHVSLITLKTQALISAWSATTFVKSVQAQLSMTVWAPAKKAAFNVFLLLLQPSPAFSTALMVSTCLKLLSNAYVSKQKLYFTNFQTLNCRLQHWVPHLLKWGKMFELCSWLFQRTNLCWWIFGNLCSWLLNDSVRWSLRLWTCYRLFQRRCEWKYMQLVPPLLLQLHQRKSTLMLGVF